MVFVPHEDDELLLMGELLDKKNYLGRKKIKVVYLTNGDYVVEADRRQIEAIRACKYFGIKKDDLIFMGFPDTPFESREPYIKRRLTAIRKAICQILKQDYPQIIFCSDLDNHPDHRALSACFDAALGQILRDESGYFPKVFKGFTYETAFYGKKDYRSIQNPLTTSTNIERLGNPSLDWTERISVFNPAGLKEKPLWKNPIFYGLVQHSSQGAMAFYTSIINLDQVFWQRRSDNLLFSPETSLEVSSGCKEYLMDFVIAYPTDFMAENLRFDTHIWKPNREENASFIKIAFKRRTDVASISLHGNPDMQIQKVRGVLKGDGEIICELTDLKKYGRETEILVKRKVKELEFWFDDISGGLSEVGVYETMKKPADCFRFVKMEQKKRIMCNNFRPFWERRFYAICWFLFRVRRKTRVLYNLLFCKKGYQDVNRF